MRKNIENPQKTNISENRKKRFKSFYTFLKRWNGGEAIIWDYNRSHSCLTIRITSKTREGNLHLICLGSERVSGPFKWNNCSFEIYDISSDEEPVFALIDETVNFRIEAGILEVKENCKPIY